jgi:hypothetical protein
LFDAINAIGAISDDNCLNLLSKVLKFINKSLIWVFVVVVGVLGYATERADTVNAK